MDGARRVEGAHPPRGRSYPLLHARGRPFPLSENMAVFLSLNPKTRASGRAKPHSPPKTNNTKRERKSSARGGGGSCRSFSLAPKTRHQPGPARRAPVARERWIGGWEAAALARRLLVLDSGCCEREVVSAGVRFQRGRGVRARAGVGRAGPKRPRDSARTAYLPFKS